MLNKIMLQGRVVNDIKLNTTPNGVSVTTFTLASERDFKQDGNRESDFIDIIAWRGNAEFAAKHFGKGDLMLVSGRLQIRKYTDNDGVSRRGTEIIADDIYFCGGKKKEAAQPDFESVEPDNFEDIFA